MSVLHVLDLHRVMMDFDAGFTGYGAIMFDRIQAAPLTKQAPMEAAKSIPFRRCQPRRPLSLQV